MPKGPNGQKRPADSIGCAVMVGKIATGEAEDDAYAASEVKGSAGGKARAQRLSVGERKAIGAAGAAARWSKKERVGMTERDRLMAALFDRPGKEHIDVKFFVGAAVDIQSEQFCSAAADMIDAMHDGVSDEDFAE